MLKKILFIAVVLVIALSFGSMMFAHSGRTDKNGGHYNRKTGIYHYHNSGYIDTTKTTRGGCQSF